MSDEARSLDVAHWETEAGRCRDCGGFRSECGHPQDCYPRAVICYPTMARAAAQREWERAHDDAPWHDGTHRSWSKEWHPDTPYHRDDGLTIVVADQDDGSWDALWGRQQPEKNVPDASASMR